MADPEPVHVVDPGDLATPDQLRAAGLVRLDAIPSDEDYLADVWRRRDFLFALPREQLRSRHQDTFLGNLWHLVNPLLSVAVYFVIFGVLLKATMGMSNYLGFLTIGVFTYGLTQGCVVDGAEAISGNLGLIRSIKFPRAVLPMSTVISHVMAFGPTMIVMGAVLIVTGESISIRWLFLPAIVGLHSVFNLGLVFIIARLNEAFRDVKRIVPFVFRLLIYISGAMFPIEQYSARASGPIRMLIQFNPVRRLIDLYRWALMGGTISLNSVAFIVLTSTLVALWGFRYFKAAELEYGRT